MRTTGMNQTVSFIYQFIFKKKKILTFQNEQKTLEQLALNFLGCNFSVLCFAKYSYMAQLVKKVKFTEKENNID